MLQEDETASQREDIEASLRIPPVSETIKQESKINDNIPGKKQVMNLCGKFQTI